MAISPPTWQAHLSPNYDAKMRHKCDALCKSITAADPAFRRGIIADPRKLHRELFEEFVPPGFTEYAGTYRGSPNTTLENRRSQANSVLGGNAYAFAPPLEVKARMDKMLADLSSQMAHASEDYVKLMLAAYAFAWFGTIHPFLDGNGHVQRALFAAVVTEMGCSLNARFAIHPRPYDRLMGGALELFATSDTNWQAELPLIMEYLSYFIDGSFAAGPRRFMPNGSSLY